MIEDRKNTYRTIVNRYYLLDPVFRNLGIDIHSSSYYRNILQFIFSESQNYSLIYADANKMREFNTIHSEKQGDLAISNSLSTILSNLPSKTIPFRIGGDEFGFYIPNSHKEELIPSVQNIETALLEKKQSSPSNYIGMSLGLSDSKNKTYVKTLEEAEKLAIINKKSCSAIKENGWKKVEDQCSLAWKDYFNLRRIDPQTLSSLNVCELTQQIQDFFGKVIEKAQLGHQNDFKNMLQNPTISSDSTIPYTTIHNFLTSSDSEIANDISEETLHHLFSIICKNSNTQLFNKTYFHNFLEHKYVANLQKGEKYLVMMHHTTGLKESNDLCGHLQTDTSLAQTAQIIQNTQKIKFNQTPLSFSNDNMMIDYNGGDFLQIINLKELPGFSKNFSLADIEESINSQLQNDFFHVVSSYQVLEKDQDISSCIESLEEACVTKTNNYKNTLSTNDKSRKLDAKLKLQVFSNIIHQFLKDYGNEAPSSQDTNSFLQIISKTYQKACQQNFHDIPR